MKARSKPLASMAAGLTVAVAAWAGAEASPAFADQTITVGPGFSFSPAEVTVRVGEPVTFTWTGTLPYNVVRTTGRKSCSAMQVAPTGVSPDDLFNSGMKIGSGTFTTTFKTPGDVYYMSTPHCQIGMTGIIHVVP